MKGERLISLSLSSPSIMSLTSAVSDLEIDIAIPARSLLVLSGDARHSWMHGIRRDEIKSLRHCVTIRELSHKFVKENSEISEQIFAISNNFI